MPIFFSAPDEPSELLPTAFAALSRSMPILRERSTTSGVSFSVSEDVRPNCTSKACAETIASSSATVTFIKADAWSRKALPLPAKAFSLFLIELLSFNCCVSASPASLANIAKPAPNAAAPTTAPAPKLVSFELMRSIDFVALPSSRSAVLPIFLNSRTAPPASASMRICNRSSRATAHRLAK